MAHGEAGLVKVTVEYRSALAILTVLTLAGCASAPPIRLATSPRIDTEAIARALAAELRQGPPTVRLDSTELLTGRSRCGTDRRVHCDPDQHPALLSALSRELNAEIIAYGEAMFCPDKRLPCLPRGEIAIVRIALPVVDSSGIIEVDLSSSLATDESVHETIFRVFLRCTIGDCTVIRRETHMIG